MRLVVSFQRRLHEQAESKTTSWGFLGSLPPCLWSCPLLSSPQRKYSGLAVQLNFLAACTGCKRISLLGREVESVESFVGGGYSPWDVSQPVGSFSALDIIVQGLG